MVLTSVLRLLWRSVVVVTTLYFFLIYAPFLIDFDPKTHDIPLPKFEGALAPNSKLSAAKHLLSGRVQGPESIAIWNGQIYTGLGDGRIVRVDPVTDSYTTVAYVNGPTDKCELDLNCTGRPLGLRFDSRGQLFTIDAYHGLKQVDVQSGQVKTLLSTSNKRVIAGRPIVFIDDLVIDEGAGQNGGHVFYISDSSGKWPLEYVSIVVWEHESSGRILKFDQDTGKVVAIGELNGQPLGFPNGLELTTDRQAILFNELNKRRIIKHFIRGPREGQSEIWSENLPGEPDNIRRSARTDRETYWVGLYSGKSPDLLHQDPLSDWLSTLPTIRKALFRFSYHVGQGLVSIGETFAYYPLKELGYRVRTTYAYQDLYKPTGMVIELDHEGKIIRSLQSPDGHTTLLAEARHTVEGGKEVLYLGSYFNRYLGRLELN